MILDQNYLSIPFDLETYALEHPMIPLGEAARDADHLEMLKTLPRLMRQRRRQRRQQRNRETRLTLGGVTPPLINTAF